MASVAAPGAGPPSSPSRPTPTNKRRTMLPAPVGHSHHTCHHPNCHHPLHHHTATGAAGAAAAPTHRRSHSVPDAATSTPPAPPPPTASPTAAPSTAGSGSSSHHPSPQLARRARAPSSAALRARIQRASNARLYLLMQTGPNAFLVGGDDATRKFKVCLGSRNQCTCKQPHCIHFLYVMLRVLRVAPDDPRLLHDSLKEFEVESLVRDFNANGGRFNHSHYRREHGDCRICLLQMDEGESLTSCLFCKNLLHKHCMSVWAQFRLQEGFNVYCPLCRTPWSQVPSDPSSAKGWRTAAIAACTVQISDTDIDEIQLPYLDSTRLGGSQRRTRPWIEVYGDHLVACFLSKKWDAREAALRKMRAKLQSALAAKQDTTRMLPVTLAMLQVSASDAVFKVFRATLALVPLLRRALQQHASVSSLSATENLEPLLEQIIIRCGDIRPRFSAESLEALFALMLDDPAFTEFAVRCICKSGREALTIVGESEADGHLPFRWWLGRLAVLRELAKQQPAFFMSSARGVRRDGKRGKAAPGHPPPPRRYASAVVEWCAPAVKHHHQDVRRSAFALTRQIRRIRRRLADPSEDASEDSEYPSDSEADPDAEPAGPRRETLRSFIAMLRARGQGGTSSCQREMAEAQAEAEAEAGAAAAAATNTTVTPSAMAKGPACADDDEELAVCLATVESCMEAERVVSSQAQAAGVAAGSGVAPDATTTGKASVSDLVLALEASRYLVSHAGHVVIDADYLEGTLWTKEEMIGTGAFSSAFVARDTQTGFRMAAKQLAYVRNTADAELESLQTIAKEINVMRHLPRHPHVVDFVGAVRERNHVNVFMEFVCGGSIADLLAAEGPLPMPAVQTYTKQISDGVAFLHENQILHRDLKGANVLVTADRAAVKLCDFGASSRMGAEHTLTAEFNSTHGTPAFMAPEVIRGECYGRKADVWSIGCCVIEMASGRTPWTESGIQNQFALMYKIASTPALPELPMALGGPSLAFVLACLQRDCHERATTRDLLLHEFLASSPEPPEPEPEPKPSPEPVAAPSRESAV